jgi:hypothetical protein
VRWSSAPSLCLSLRQRTHYHWMVHYKRWLMASWLYMVLNQLINKLFIVEFLVIYVLFI